MVNTTNLGRVGFVLKSEYDASTQYKKLDVVIYNGNSYAAKQDNQGILPTDPTYWQVITDISATLEAAEVATNAANAAAENANNAAAAANEAAQAATNEEISNRTSDAGVIVPENLDYAVKVVMTDGKGKAWSSEEQASAKERIGIKVDDVQIENTSIVENGIANIPIATTQNYGVIKPSYGVFVEEDGSLKIDRATKWHIDERLGAFNPITSSNIDYAVKAAMCDGKGEDWTEEEQFAARERIGANDIFDKVVSILLTTDNYFSVMKMWFDHNGSAALADFSPLCDKWYTITRQGWTGGTRFYHASQSMVSTGTKVGDNADMVAETSTNTTKGRDDYAGVPLFACVDCNWYLDESGKPHITAIDGIAGNFERYNPEKFVGVLQMTGFHKLDDNPADGTFTHMYTDIMDMDGYKPLPEAVDLDGTVRTWVVHAKYASGDDYASYSGAKPWVYTASHNSAITNFHKHGNQYGGKTSADDAFIKLMFYLKYASLTADGILQDCVSYNIQYAVAEQETGVERVILTASQANNVKVGSTVIVGNPTAFNGANLNVDRGQAGMRAKVDRKLVTRKETLASGNVAIYIDNGGVTFDTTANTINNAGDAPTYITSMQWYTGTCDNVLGNDGSPSTPTNGSEPVILQGIEYGMGAYEIVSDCILKYRKDANGKYWLGVYVCRDASKYSAGITADYEQVGYEVACPASNNWQYISELGFDPAHPEVWFPHLIGCTSSQRTKDAIYILATSESVYEWLSLGRLSGGVGNGGLSLVSAYHGLGRAWWDVLARLSATGNRG